MSPIRRLQLKIRELATKICKNSSIPKIQRASTNSLNFTPIHLNFDWNKVQFEVHYYTHLRINFSFKIESKLDSIRVPKARKRASITVISAGAT